MAAPPIPVASTSDANTAPTLDSAAANATPPQQKWAFPTDTYQDLIKVTPEEAAKYARLKANPYDSVPYPLNRRRKRRRPAPTNPVNKTAPEGRRLFDGNFYDDIHNIKEGRLYMGPEIDRDHKYLGGKTMSELHEEMSNRHAMIMASYNVALTMHRNLQGEKKKERAKAASVQAGFAVQKQKAAREEARMRNLEAQQAGTQQ